MKVGLIHDSVVVDFDQGDLERLGRGEVSIRDLVDEAIATHVVTAEALRIFKMYRQFVAYEAFYRWYRYVRLSVRPKPGHWYHVEPAMDGTTLPKGSYKVAMVANRVETVFQVHTSNGLSAVHSLGFYRFTNGPYKYLRMKFVPAAYSTPDFKRVVVEHVFNELKLQRVCDEGFNFMKGNGYGEYFFQTGSREQIGGHRIENNWSVFYVPQKKGDPKVWFPTDTDGWRVCSYTGSGFDHQPETVWYIIHQNRQFLWKDGLTSANHGTHGTGYTTGMTDLTDAPGYFDSEETANRFLTAWINQDRKPYAEWKLHTYDVEVYSSDGIVDKSQMLALDLYGVAETICDECPECQIIRVEDLGHEKLGVKSL